MKYTRNSVEGAKRCIKCDNECTGTYYCHAGAGFAVVAQQMGELAGQSAVIHKEISDAAKKIKDSVTKMNDKHNK